MFEVTLLQLLKNTLWLVGWLIINQSESVLMSPNTARLPRRPLINHAPESTGTLGPILGARADLSTATWTWLPDQNSTQAEEISREQSHDAPAHVWCWRSQQSGPTVGSGRAGMVHFVPTLSRKAACICKTVLECLVSHVTMSAGNAVTGLCVSDYQQITAMQHIHTATTRTVCTLFDLRVRGQKIHPRTLMSAACWTDRRRRRSSSWKLCDSAGHNPDDVRVMSSGYLSSRGGRTHL